MAGAVARYVKWFFPSPLSVMERISIAALPFIGYILVQQEKESARLDEREMLLNKRLDAMIARGFIRVREQ